MSRSFAVDPPLVDVEMRVLLRSRAMSANRDGRRWFSSSSLHPDHPGYPQRVSRMGDVALICECYDEPTSSMPTADFIAAVSPPVVLALLDEIDRLEARV